MSDVSSYKLFISQRHQLPVDGRQWASDALVYLMHLCSYAYHLLTYVAHDEIEVVLCF